MLYIVATPVGNLKDITLRALETLKSVDLILAEDTRITKRLLNHYEIDTPLRSYHTHNEHSITNSIVEELKGGKEIALVSDAGTPGISDPGYLLVKACRDNGIKVIPVPGPAALIAALSASGLPTDRFHFEGFLPHKKGRNKRWEFLKNYPHTIVLYESPYRIIKLLNEICLNMGENTSVVIARELTKIHEEIINDSCINHLKRLKEKEKIKGEFVVIISAKNE